MLERSSRLGHNFAGDFKEVKKIVFFIDMEKFETEETQISARRLITEFAGEDANNTTLATKHGNEIKKFGIDEIVELKNGMKLLIFFNDPTPVSDTEAVYGPDRLKGDLESLGYKVINETGSDGQIYTIILSYLIEVGRFMGRVIDLGLMAVPNYPQGVASAIHVRANPQLFDTSDSVSGVRNIQPSNLGRDWRYWSINFNWEGERTTRRLMSQVNTVFNHA